MRAVSTSAGMGELPMRNWFWRHMDSARCASSFFSNVTNPNLRGSPQRGVHVGSAAVLAQRCCAPQEPGIPAAGHTSETSDCLAARQ